LNWVAAGDMEMDWNVFKKNSSIDGFGIVWRLPDRWKSGLFRDIPMMKRRLIYFVVVLVMICLLPLAAIGY